jgi:superfamily I DNA/RNA helicase
MDCTLAAYRRALRAAELQRFRYSLAVAKRHGAQVLREVPRLVIGTIHSVKGGEADVIYLSPELSAAGAAAWRSQRDTVIRQFYVGLTRAKESLVLVSAAPRAAYLPELVKTVVATR